jgi:hypothetical protein
MTTLVLCSDKMIENMYREKFNTFVFGDKNVVDNKGVIGSFDNILIIGEYVHIPYTKAKVSWLVTESINQILLESGMYDRVDYFFGMYIENLKARFGENYVKMGDDIQFGYRLTAPVYLSTEMRENIVNEIVQRLVGLMRTRNSYSDSQKLLSGRSLASVIPRNILSNSMLDYINKMIMFVITGDPQAPPKETRYELTFETITTHMLRDLITHYYRTYKMRQVSDNIKLVNTNFQNVHRSGWQYIVENMLSLTCNEKIIIDTYVDKTFNWNNSFYERERVVPYRSKWYGFIHHTDYPIDNNCSNLFKNQNFLASVYNCAGLFVFTEHLKYQLIKLFNKNNITPVPIHVVRYGSESVDEKFTVENFMSNHERKIVQIGGWMRNMFGIYRLELNPQSDVKKALLGPINEPINELNSIPNPIIKNPKYICEVDFDEKVILGLNSYLSEKVSEVEIIKLLTNTEYDQLLSKNLVFLNLVDASAVNTLVECIMRNTPILINKIAPVIEFLGENYPFYYTTFFEA